VDHIYYESETVNNVTIYKVDLIPQQTPSFFRSGMNATIDFIVEKKENALLLNQEAVYSENGEHYVLIKNPNGKEYIRRPVVTGSEQDKNIEIISGISADDIVIIKSRKYALPTVSSLGKNPFMPERKRPSTGNGNQTKTGNSPR